MTQNKPTPPQEPVEATLEPEPMSHYARAHAWVEDIRTEPLDTEQAIALAGVMATLAVVDAITAVTRREES